MVPHKLRPLSVGTLEPAGQTSDSDLRVSNFSAAVRICHDQLQLKEGRVCYHLWFQQSKSPLWRRGRHSMATGEQEAEY